MAEVLLQCADYTVGWVCALSLELAAATTMLDELHETPSDLIWERRDRNQYTFGQIGRYNIVVAVLPAGIYGTTSAAIVTKMMSDTFSKLHFVLMIGIGGGVPSQNHDIRLGDIVVSEPGSGYPGVLQYDFGKTGRNGEVVPGGTLNKPPPEVLTTIAGMKAKHMISDNGVQDTIEEMLARYPKMRKDFCRPGTEDVLYHADYDHVGGNTCAACNPGRVEVRPPRETNELIIHYGLIASGNQVIKDGRTRERLREKFGVLCFETEAAGMMDTHPCLVVRGICDYADSHKNNRWQGYAAATAAAYTKCLLLSIGAPGFVTQPEFTIPRQTHPPNVTRSTHDFGSRLPTTPPSSLPVSPTVSNTPVAFLAAQPTWQSNAQSRVLYGQKLLEAADRGDKYLIKMLIKKGGDPNAMEGNWKLTALHYTARNGDLGSTQLLLEAGANPNAEAKFNRGTPLSEASCKGHTEVIQCLLRHGASATARGSFNRTALHAAAANGHLASAILLINCGADTRSRDDNGDTPLDLAQKKGWVGVVQYLQKL